MAPAILSDKFLCCSLRKATCKNLLAAKIIAIMIQASRRRWLWNHIVVIDTHVAALAILGPSNLNLL